MFDSIQAQKYIVFCLFQVDKDNASDQQTPVELQGNCESIGIARDQIEQLVSRENQFRD